MEESRVLTEFSNLFLGNATIGIGRIVLSVVIAMIFGIVLSYIYRSYFHIYEPQDRSICRSFPLMAPAITMIFILIQFSLPLSLGLLGALSFVRFRTPIKRAEDIAFILVLIAIGLSCAILYFHAAISLLLLLLLFGTSRRYFPQLQGNPPKAALVTVHSPTMVDFQAIVLSLSDEFSTPTLISSQSSDNSHSLVFNLTDHTQERHTELVDKLSIVSGPGAQVDVYFPDNQLIE